MKNLTSLILFLATTLSWAQHAKNFASAKPEDVGMSSARLERIDKYVQGYVNKMQIPGAVVLIVRNGKIAYEKSFGYADAENKTPLKTDNIFRIASQSKAITSLAVMMLYEEAKFQLDDPISKYIPEFKNPTVLEKLNWSDTTYTSQSANSEITIRQLLTHTSGIDYPSIGTKEMQAIYFKAGVPSGIGNDGSTIGEKVKILARLPLKHNPGERFTYGLNTDVLGYLVEVLSGMKFDQFLRERIFQPLGMNDTWFYLPKEKQDRLVTLYENKEGVISKVDHKIYDGANPDFPKLRGGYFSGGAGLSSTVEDYAKFLQLFLNKGEFNGVRLLSRKTVELMLTNQIQPPLENQFGLGFGLETEKNDFSSIATIGSFSWGGAFNTTYWADPKENLIGLIYTNIYYTSYRSIGNDFKVLTYQAIAD